jgi:hypothetical protein
LIFNTFLKSKFPSKFSIHVRAKVYLLENNFDLNAKQPIFVFDFYIFSCSRSFLFYLKNSIWKKKSIKRKIRNFLSQTLSLIHFVFWSCIGIFAYKNVFLHVFRVSNKWDFLCPFKPLSIYIFFSGIISRIWYKKYNIIRKGKKKRNINLRFWNKLSSP